MCLKDTNLHLTHHPRWTGEPLLFLKVSVASLNDGPRLKHDSVSNYIDLSSSVLSKLRQNPKDLWDHSLNVDLPC